MSVDRPPGRHGAGDLDARLGRIRQVLAANDADRATALADALVADHPDSAAAHGMLGVVRIRRGDPAGAVLALRRSAALQPTSEALSNLSLALLALGDAAAAVEAGRRALATDARSISAHLNLACALDAQGGADESLSVLQAAARLAPDDAAVAVNLGVALTRAGRPLEAITALTRVVGAQPDAADARFHLGVALLAAGQPDAAREQLLRLVERGVRAAELFFNLGAAETARSMPYAALDAFRQAAALRPDWTAAWLAVAEAAAGCDAADVALDALERACDLCPTDPDPHIRAGVALRRADRLEAAVARLQRAVALSPRSVPALNNLALCLRDLGRLGEAEALLDQALAVAPDNPGLLSNAGSVQHRLMRDDAAGRLYRRSLDVAPEDRSARLGLAGLACDGGALEEARRLYDEILRRWPDCREALCGRGIVAYRRGDLAAADHDLDRAVALAPDWAEARFSRSLSRLKQGDCAAGWEDFEARLKLPDHALRTWRPRGVIWSGEPLAGRRILLKSEQGLGDHLQCARYLPDLTGLGAEVWVESRPGLDRIMTSLGARIADGAADAPAPEFELPMFSLPRRFGARISGDHAPPRAAGYVSADPDLAARWAERLPPGPRIGLVWQGSAGGRVDQGRSFPLAALLNALRSVPSSLVSLQKGAGRDQLAAPDLRLRVIDPDDLAPELGFRGGDLMDTAALIQAVDLVIACDTAVAHLAGALGRPVIVVVGVSSDWRWLVDRADSPWYRSARIVRRRLGEGWGTALDQAARAAATTLRSAG